MSGRAIVRVRACALNHLDLWERRGIDRVVLPLPHISGSDISGEVLDSGSAAIASGTRVMLQPGLRCGTCAACRAGRDNECPSYDVLGLRSDGGYAELVSVPGENLVPIPAHIDFVTAAAFPLTFLTAWHMLITRAQLQPGETVLVLAGGSGVGQAAIQVARMRRRARPGDLGASQDGSHPGAWSRRGPGSLRGRFLERGRGASPTAAASTSSSNMSGRRRGTEASARSQTAGGW